MTDRNIREGLPKPMSMKMFLRFTNYINKDLGIKMTEAKKTMLQARLQKRLRTLGIESYDEYYDYVFSPRGLDDELPNMIDVITTNKTDFFREPKHFDYLTSNVLPELARRYGTGVNRKIMFWSAGCSTGEEPYTMAMVLSDFSVRFKGFQFGILATDISTKVLKEGMAGIYTHDKVEPVPLPMRKRYLLRSKDRKKDLVRVAPALRSAVRFQRLNFMDREYRVGDAIDIIFCRNVLIYFDRPTQEFVLNRLCRHLRPEGFLFTGHSETLNGLDVPLVPVTSTVYRLAKT